MIFMALFNNTEGKFLIFQKNYLQKDAYKAHVISEDKMYKKMTNGETEEIYTATCNLCFYMPYKSAK